MIYMIGPLDDRLILHWLELQTAANVVSSVLEDVV